MKRFLFIGILFALCLTSFQAHAQRYLPGMKGLQVTAGIETLPVPKRLKVGETAEIRCRLVREGYYQPTTYQIRYFQPDGKGKLEMDNGTVFLPNDLYPLEKETFRLYYTSASTDQQTIDIYVIDSFGQVQQLSLSFNNDNSKEETETITPKQ